MGAERKNLKAPFLLWVATWAGLPSRSGSLLRSCTCSLNWEQLAIDWLFYGERDPLVPEATPPRKLLLRVGKTWERTPVSQFRVKSHRINGPPILVRSHNPKVARSNRAPATIF